MSGAASRTKYWGNHCLTYPILNPKLLQQFKKRLRILWFRIDNSPENR